MFEAIAPASFGTRPSLIAVRSAMFFLALSAETMNSPLLAKIKFASSVGPPLP